MILDVGEVIDEYYINYDYPSPRSTAQFFTIMVTHLVINLIQQGLNSRWVTRQETVFPFGASRAQILRTALNLSSA